MNMLLAIDPGVRALGWAYFEDGRLVQAGLLRAKHIQEMVDQLWLLDLHPVSLVIERPQVYGGAKFDPNDLVGLAVVAGAAAGRFHMAKNIDFPLPRMWKGQVPKDIHHERVLRALSIAERGQVPNTTKSLQHNVLDAVGLGLWKIGRAA